jgi:excisionase family DNA binding protein
MSNDEPRFSRETAEDRLLDAHEVAGRLGVPVSWVYAQTRAGRIPTVRLGRYYRYRPSAIAAWISSLEAGTAH